MKKLASFIDMAVSPSNLTTGKITTYTFAFITGQELVSGVTLEIDLPVEVVLQGTLICATNTSLALKSVACIQLSTCLTGSSTKFATSKLQVVLTFQNSTLT